MPPPTKHSDPQAISEAAHALRRGEPVVFPTETVYGLGADATNGTACARIYEIKGRPSFNPLIVHLGDADQLSEVAAEVPSWARDLAARFWPGPLTLVLPKTSRIADLVTAGLPRVAVRVPRHPMAVALLRAAQLPIAAPSANRFTRLSPTRVEHARQQLGDAVSYYLDGGPCEVGLESTIIADSGHGPQLLRHGGIPQEAIEQVVGPVKSPPTDSAILAPGMFRKHYSPTTPLWLEEEAALSPHSVLGLLTLKAGPRDLGRFRKIEVLSPEGNLADAAAGLFAALQRLESSDLDAIVARRFPEQGLGVAINDRLRRAAAEHL